MSSIQVYTHKASPTAFQSVGVMQLSRNSRFIPKIIEKYLFLSITIFLSIYVYFHSCSSSHVWQLITSSLVKGIHHRNYICNKVCITLHQIWNYKTCSDGSLECRIILLACIRKSVYNNFENFATNIMHNKLSLSNYLL